MVKMLKGVFLPLYWLPGRGSFLRDVAQSGSALRSGRRGRWFESSHPDKIGRSAFVVGCPFIFIHTLSTLYSPQLFVSQ